MSSRLILNPEVALAEGENGYLAYHSGTAQLHDLNAAASLLVSLCDGSRDLAALQTALAQLLDGQGVADWMEKAEADGLVVPADGAIEQPRAEHFSSLAADLRAEGSVIPAFVCQFHAADLAPDDTDIAYGLAELAHIIGRRDIARASYQRYLDAHPEDAEVAHILISLSDRPPPQRASDQAIAVLYARFSENYDESMCVDLEYRAPDLMEQAVAGVFEDQGDLEILDIGCGTGLSGTHLRDRAGLLVGIDLSPDMIARAHARGIYDRLETAEITAWLKHDDGSRFDLITACDCLIYFGDLAQVLTPARKRLKPGGCMVLTVERGDVAPFTLTDNGRFTHHRTHIEQAARPSGFRVGWIDEAVLRHEYGEPVVGLIVTLHAVGSDVAAALPSRPAPPGPR